MSDKHHGNPVATYIITALILGVITYVEYAIVEYEIAWLSREAIIFWLIALSVVKFVMVVAIFMHLKDDERTYTGFFGSGMLIALATFFVLPLLFTVRTIPGRAEAAPAGAHSAPTAGAHGEAAGNEHAGEGGHGLAGLSEEERAAIESDGASRPRSEVLDSPPPSRRSLRVEPPAAREPGATLRSQSAGEQPEQGAVEDEEEGVPEQARADAGDEARKQAGEAEQEAGATQDEQADAPEDEEAGEPQGALQAEFDRDLGASTYAGMCQGCHQANGEGIPGVFPPLADNMPRLLAAQGGREYLIDVVVHGMSGQIEVDGQTYNGMMPAWASLSDDQIAAVLNHELTSWGNQEAVGAGFTPVAADEIAARRGEQPGDLAERRAQLQAR